VGHRLSETIRRTFIGRLLLTYLNSSAPHYAPAIAFNAFVALFPITVGLVSALVLFGPGGGITRQVDRIILSHIVLFGALFNDMRLKRWEEQDAPLTA
jgi:hypothetical protein